MSSREEKQVAAEIANLCKQFSLGVKMASKVSDSTLLNYANAMSQLAQQKENAKTGGEDFKLDYDNKNTRTVFASAIRRDALNKLQTLGQDNTYSQAQHMLAEITHDLVQVEAMRAKYRAEPKSKKSSLSLWTLRLAKLEKVYPNWRDELQTKMAKSKYAGCIAVQRASGCRTEELVRGVKISRDGAGGYLIEIDTAKQRAVNKDNRIRIIRSTDRRLEQFLGLVKLEVERKNSKPSESRSNKIKKAKNAYKQAMMNASKRLFGLPVSPKAFRSSIASDLRAAGALTPEVAENLGHGDTACANRYSRGLNVRGKARSTPTSVVLARVKVQSKPVSNSKMITQSKDAPSSAPKT